MHDCSHFVPGTLVRGDTVELLIPPTFPENSKMPVAEFELLNEKVSLNRMSLFQSSNTENKT